MTPLVPPTLGIFGGVAAIGDEGPVDLGGPKQRSVLTVLLLQPGTAVSIGRLVDMVWGDAAPGRADVSIRGYVSNLRRVLGAIGANPATVIPFREGGYALEFPPERIDMHQFENLAQTGIAAQRLGHPDATEQLTRALELWTGEPFGSLSDRLDLRDIVARLERVRGDAIEALIDLRLDRGDHHRAAIDLRVEIDRYPYRERLRAQLALALYRTGDAVQALRSLDETRRVLGEDIGVDPGPDLTTLQAAILGHDPSLHWTAPAIDLHPTTTIRSDRSGRSAVVGRQREFEALERVLDRLESGGSVVVLSGEAGIGKSTLARAFVESASSRGLSAGWGKCTEAASVAAYRPWRSATRDIGTSATLNRALDPNSTFAATDDDQATARIQRHLAAVDSLRALDRPIVVVIDDLQWADDATLSLLDFMAAEIDELPVVVVVTVRRTRATVLAPAVTSCLAELSRSPGCTTIELGRLDRKAVVDWVDSIAGSGPDLVDVALRVTDGNPFYLREFLSLQQSEARLTANAVEVTGVRVPIAVQDVVRRRTSLLPPGTQATLSTAAVIGRHFDVDILAAVLDSTTTVTLDALADAVGADLVEPDTDRPGRFGFSHALVREVLVAEQNTARLAATHARITAELERLRPERVDLVLEELAHHAWAGATAGTADRALGYALQAAEIAQRGQSSGDVAQHLARALTLMESSAGSTTGERIALMIRLGRARRDAGDIAEGRATIFMAASLAESVADDASAAQALDVLNADDLWAGVDWSLYDEGLVALIERMLERSTSSTPAVIATLSSSLAGELIYLDPLRADLLSTAAVEAAQQTGDPVLLARTMLQRLWGLTGSAHVAARRDLGDRFVELAQTSSLPDRLLPLAHLAPVSAAYEMGDIDSVRRCHRAAAQVAHPARTPIGWVHYLYLDTSLAILAGDLDRAEALTGDLEQALSRVRRFAATPTRAGLLALIHAERGNTAAAVAQLEILDASPFGAAAGWLKAWVLAEGGLHDDARNALGAFTTRLPDDWLRVTMTVAGILAASEVRDIDFLRAHLPDLDPVADRFACVGNGGLVLGPVSYAIGAGLEVLGHRPAALRAASSALALSQQMGAALWVPRARRLVDRLEHR
ncbi:MAG: BTAD domain-containing putative transcriptional regulator [Actinomycetota bacterium]|nr:BTAD domain-containing putative transcriptional regulator [Actinomycetota bacterium]